MATTTLADARSLLFVPGHRPDRFGKARDSGVDRVIIDLEDAVGEANKDVAREHVTTWLSSGHPGIVRINATGTPWYERDLEAILRAAPTTILMLPKATMATVDATAEHLPSAGQILPLIETAQGLLDAAAIARSPRVGRLAFGNIDLSTEIGVDPDDERALLWARSMLVVASAAATIAPPIDGVTTAIHDNTAVANDTRAARSLGFTGKLCIHPCQVATVHDALEPTELEVRHAQRVLATAASDVSSLDGRMLDRPVVERARRILRVSSRRA